MAVIRNTSRHYNCGDALLEEVEIAQLFLEVANESCEVVEDSRNGVLRGSFRDDCDNCEKTQMRCWIRGKFEYGNGM